MDEEDPGQLVPRVSIHEMIILPSLVSSRGSFAPRLTLSFPADESPPQGLVRSKENYHPVAPFSPGSS